MESSQFTVRTMESWRARKAVLASRGEVDGPRVEEANRALSWYRAKALIEREVKAGAIPATEAPRLIAALTGAMRTDKPAEAVPR